MQFLLFCHILHELAVMRNFVRLLSFSCAQCRQQMFAQSCSICCTDGTLRQSHRYLRAGHSFSMSRAAPCLPPSLPPSPSHIHFISVTSCHMFTLLTIHSTFNVVICSARSPKIINLECWPF